jgi:hypothetical protein
MTRVRRVPKHRRLIDLPEDLVGYLQTGRYEDAGFEVFQIAGTTMRGNFSGIQDLWSEAILEEWLADHPGTRPFAWWVLVAPEPRAVLVGAELTLAVAYPRYFAGETTWRWRHGIPAFAACRPPDCAKLPHVESQATFLDRHGVLAAEERAALDADDFEDEEINPFVVVAAYDDDDPDEHLTSKSEEE